jgi:hypothetical protein
VKANFGENWRFCKKISVRQNFAIFHFWGVSYFFGRGDIFDLAYLGDIQHTL